MSNVLRAIMVVKISGDTNMSSESNAWSKIKLLKIDNCNQYD